MGRRLPLDAVAVVTVATVLGAAFLAAGPGPVADGAYLAGVLLTGGAALTWSLTPSRRSVLGVLLGVSVLLEGLGDLLTLLLSDADGDLPVPSWADVPYLAGSAFSLAALLALAWRWRGAVRAVALDTLMATGGLLVLSVQVGIWPAMTDDGTPLQRLVTGYYAGEDLVFVAVAGWILLARRQVPAGAALVAAAALIWFAGDLWWAVDQLTLGAWHNGTWRDLLWYVPSVLFALGIRARVDTAVAGDGELGLTSRRLLVAGTAGMIGPVGLVAVSASGGQVPAPVLALSCLLPLGAALARTFLVLRRLEDQALRDPLTGLLNRRAFEAEARSLLAQRRAGGIALVDLDDFKEINDRYGHAAGDAVLAAVAGRLARAVPGGRAVRLGGDEFAVLVPHGTVVEPGALAGALTGAVRYEGRELAVGASIGWAPAAPEPDVESLEELLARADAEMYRAKAAARSAGVPAQRGEPASGPVDRRVSRRGVTRPG